MALSKEAMELLKAPSGLTRKELLPPVGGWGLQPQEDGIGAVWTHERVVDPSADEESQPKILGMIIDGPPAATEKATRKEEKEQVFLDLPIIAGKGSGGTYNLTQQVAKGSVAVVFYDGEWKKLFSRTLRNWNSSINKFESRGISFVVVTPESDLQNGPFAEVVKMKKLGFPIVQDVRASIKRRYSDELTNVDNLCNDYDIQLETFREVRAPNPESFGTRRWQDSRILMLVGDEELDVDVHHQHSSKQLEAAERRKKELKVKDPYTLQMQMDLRERVDNKASAGLSKIPLEPSVVVAPRSDGTNNSEQASKQIPADIIDDVETLFQGSTFQGTIEHEENAAGRNLGDVLLSGGLRSSRAGAFSWYSLDINNTKTGGGGASLGLRKIKDVISVEHSNKTAEQRRLEAKMVKGQSASWANLPGGAGLVNKALRLNKNKEAMKSSNANTVVARSDTARGGEVGGEEEEDEAEDPFAEFRGNFSVREQKRLDDDDYLENGADNDDKEQGFGKQQFGADDEESDDDSEESSPQEESDGEDEEVVGGKRGRDKITLGVDSDQRASKKARDDNGQSSAPSDIEQKCGQLLQTLSGTTVEKQKLLGKILVSLADFKLHHQSKTPASVEWMKRAKKEIKDSLTRRGIDLSKDKITLS